jgi:hypothetical protein
MPGEISLKAFAHRTHEPLCVVPSPLLHVYVEEMIIFQSKVYGVQKA